MEIGGSGVIESTDKPFQKHLLLRNLRPHKTGMTLRLNESWTLAEKTKLTDLTIPRHH